MKKIIFLISFLVVIFLSNRLLTNPVIEHHFNEFSIDFLSWKIELNQIYESMDGWFITSLTDTGYFKNGIYPEEYLVITNDSLQSDLYINPNGDKITLFDAYSHQRDELEFGKLEYYSILAPISGQSICRNSERLFFDKSPTFGYENDFTDCDGIVEGYIKDSLDNPIENVKVIYDYWIPPGDYRLDSIYVLTDSSGYFKFSDFASVTIITCKANNYNNAEKTVQIWPDSTIKIDIKMKLIVGVEKILSPIINDFYLSQNFPNPFNNSTSFFYTLPKGDNVEITIYDEKGALVKKLFSGYQSAGKYKVNWKTDNLASGVYMYQVRTGSFNISKKAILLK